MKRIITFALVIAMVICMVPAFAVSADTEVYATFSGAQCSVPGESNEWNNGRRTQANEFDLDYYEKDLYAPAVTLEEGKVYKALYFFSIKRVNAFNDTAGWEVKCMPTEEYYFNITNADISNEGNAQTTVVSVPFKVTNPSDVKLKLWTHGALVDGSTLVSITVVGADYNAYNLGADKVVEGVANAGSNKENNKPADNEWTVSDKDSASTPEPDPEPTGLQKGATVDGGVWEAKNGTYTLKETRARDHTGFNTYILGSSDKKITLKYDFVVGDGDSFASDVGFLLAVEDLNNDGKIYEGDDNYYLVDLRADGSVGIEKNAKNWGGWKIESTSFAASGDKVSLEVTYDPAAHTIKVVANGNEVLNWTDSDNQLGGTGYALASKQKAGSTIVKTPNPATGDSAAIVLVVVSVIALAGAALAAKKRAFQK